MRFMIIRMLCVSTFFPYTTLFRSIVPLYFALLLNELTSTQANFRTAIQTGFSFLWAGAQWLDRKSTRLNSSHVAISYAVFCLKKKAHDSHADCYQYFGVPAYGTAN